MKTDTPRPILLKDYRPSNYLIDTVLLDVSLDPKRTRVRARLKVRRNPVWPGNPGPLQLDGETIELESLRLDGRQLGPREHEVTDKELVIPHVPAHPFTVETVTYCNPEANKALMGLYLSRGVYCTQCEAQGFRRITYFIDRPDVLATYTTRIEADRSEAPVLLANGDPLERGTLDGGKRHYAVWKDPHPKPSYLFALVGGNLASYASDFTTASGRKVDLRIYVEPGKEGRCAWAMDFAQALHALGRGALRARVRLERVQRRCRLRLQHGGDGEQGPQHLQRRPDPGLAGDRHGRELLGHRARDRARVLPQLDRQPHHLPRLVPALPQGRADRLPRPGVLRRDALADGGAHPRRAHAEGRAVPRGRGPARPSRASEPLHRDQQLLYVDRLQQGRRARAHDPDAAGERGFPQGHGPLFRAP